MAKVRNYHAVHARQRKAGAHADTRKGRGGARNLMQEYLLELEEHAETKEDGEIQKEPRTREET